MKKIRTLVSMVLVFVFLTALSATALAADKVTHEIADLHFSIDLPDTWTVCTRRNYNEISEYVKAARGFETEEEWLQFLASYEFYMFATVPGNSKQYEIYVSSYDDYDESIDYNDCYNFELKFTAKASYNTNNKEQGVNKYMNYSVVKGDNTKYIVFDYTGTDDSGNVTYGRLYHTVVNGNAMDFDLSSYDKDYASSEFMKVFEEAVMGINYTYIPVEKEGLLNQRQITDLRYLALILLGVALVVVIIIYIVSKVQERSKLNNAMREAEHAQQEIADTDSADTDTGSTDTDSADTHNE